MQALAPLMPSAGNHSPVRVLDALAPLCLAVAFAGLSNAAAPQAPCFGWSTASSPPVVAIDRIPADILIWNDHGQERLTFVTEYSSSGLLPFSEVWALQGSSYVLLADDLPVRSPELSAVDLGSGPELFVHGTTPPSAGTMLYRYNGQDFAPFGPPITPPSFIPSVQEVAAFDFGSGPELVIGGSFGTGSPLQSIARWHQGAWAPLSAPFGQLGIFLSLVTGLETLDFGAGPRLVAVGHESPLGGLTPLTIIYSQTGHQYAPAPPTPIAHTTAVADFGLGQRLYAVSQAAVHEFDGVAWKTLVNWQLGIFIQASSVLAVPDFFGNGPRLLVNFHSFATSSAPVRHLFSYDGLSFTDIDAGILEYDDLPSKTSLTYGSPFPGQETQLLLGGSAYILGEPAQGLVSYSCPGPFYAVQGCQPKRLSLSSSADTFAIGKPYNLKLSAAPGDSGLVQLWLGGLSSDLFGCGSPTPAFGELLLAPASPLATTDMVNGLAQFTSQISQRPTLVGLEVAFQAFLLPALNPSGNLVPSNALVGSIGS
jgi:hypothetical protein